MIGVEVISDASKGSLASYWLSNKGKPAIIEIKEIPVGGSAATSICPVLLVGLLGNFMGLGALSFWLLFLGFAILAVANKVEGL